MEVSIDSRFTIERHGRTFVLYGGLLDAAHEQGLASIDQEILQYPGPDNNHTTIVKAVVVMEGGKRFSGVGDASPDNVGKNIAPHAIRMAATRACARALRDAINVGSAAIEELGEEGAGEADLSPPDNGSSTKPVRSLDRTASEETVEALQRAIEDSGRSIDKFEEHYGCPIHEVAEGFARKWIEHLSKEEGKT